MPGRHLQSPNQPPQGSMSLLALPSTHRPPAVKRRHESSRYKQNINGLMMSHAPLTNMNCARPLERTLRAKDHGRGPGHGIVPVVVRLQHATNMPRRGPHVAVQSRSLSTPKARSPCVSPDLHE